MAPNTPVQDRALEYVEMLDQMEKSKARADMVRGLFSSKSTDREVLKEQFPEYFDHDPFRDARTEGGEIDPDKVDESGLDWATPGDEADDEDISSWIAAREKGSFTATDLTV